MRMLTIVPLCLAVAACSGGDEANNQSQAAPATLPAGVWQATFQVTKFASADKSIPALKAKIGDKEQDSTCVQEAQRAQPDPALFAGSGYSCTYQNSYIKDGMVNATMTCTRPGLKGDISMAVSGSYGANSFAADVDTISYLVGGGNFRMSRKVTAKLAPGACQPAPAADGNASAGAKDSKGG